MSGIVGTCALNSEYSNPESIHLMLKSLSHRGPDGTGFWSEGSISFGHQMLWTTPESLLEKLPYCCPIRKLTITADARIDNRTELIPLLRICDRPPEKITDSELILAAYEKWGEQSVDHLLGAFAFVIWDQEKESLFCARDHFGVKPFYFHQSALGFFFASEIKAILALPEIPRRLNEERISDFLMMMMEDKTVTSYRDIHRLPPSCCMRVSRLDTQQWSYWSLDPSLKLNLDSDEAYAQEFKNIFTEAVNCRLRSAFSIGTQLSGGLDSSAVTCVAKKILSDEGRHPIHTVSNIFEDVPECDERIFINEVINEGDVVPHYVRADQVGSISQLEEIWQYEDEAFVGPNHSLPWQLNQAAQEAGIRVFLDGFDGDTTVSHGIYRLTELAEARQWDCFYQEAMGLAVNFDTTPTHLLNSYGIPTLIKWAKRFQWLAVWHGVNQINLHFKISRRTLLFNYGLKSMIPSFIRQRWQQFRWGMTVPESVASLISQAFAARIGLDQRHQKFSQNSSSPQKVRDEQWHALNTGLLVFVLELLDRSAAAFSIEPRHPFMDKRLIEFCYAIPSDQKLHQGWSRMIMRRALNTVLPEKIQWRGGKTSMTPNFIHGMLTLDRQRFDEVVYHSPKAIKEYIDIDFLQEAYGRITSGAKVQDLDIMTVWKGIVITLWLRHHHLMPEQ